MASFVVGIMTELPVIKYLVPNIISNRAIKSFISFGQNIQISAKTFKTKYCVLVCMFLFLQVN